MNQDIFAQRRQRFYQHMQGGMAVLFSAPHATRNADSHYEYRTCSYFYYLTGVREEHAAAIFLPGSDKPFHLFVMPKNAEAEMWEGKRHGVEGAKSHFGADEAHPIDEFDAVFKKLLKTTETLFYPLGLHAEHDRKIMQMVQDHYPNPRFGDKYFRNITKVQGILDRMRLVKDVAEIELLRKNGVNSSIAHRKAMEFTRPGMYEYQVEAEIEYWFRYGGADDLAYSSIVAGGDNATILHYKTNRDLLKDNTLLLIDAGGEMDLYASDITRTFPVSGKFTPAQRRLYDLVLKSQLVAIEAVKPGLPFHQVHKASVDVLVEGLLSLGLLQGKHEEIVKDRKNYAAFYPHGTSHWLGLDVHDAGEYYDATGESVLLAPGNVLTVEPGIYIPADRMDVPAEYRGIGIRIEDDILVTAGGREVLTIGAPKDSEEIESVVGRSDRAKKI